MKKLKGFMVSIICCIWLSVFVGGAIAKTEVLGVISSNTVWNVADSPYIVTGSIMVKPKTTLTIKPGVVVKFNKDCLLQIDGTLIARGNSNKIVFTATVTTPSVNNWKYISFTDSSKDATFDLDGNYLSGSILENCIIEYTGETCRGAINLQSANPFIKNCTIRNNGAGGIYARDMKGKIKIDRCTIINNKGSGISGFGGVWRVTNNTIQKNTASDGGGINGRGGKWTVTNNIISKNTADNCGGGIRGHDSIWTIIDNTINENIAYKGGGISGLSRHSNVWTVTNNTIKENTSYHGSSGGISGSGGIWRVTNNTINDNASGDYDGGGGIYGSNGIYGIGSNWTITNNTIKGNSAFITSAIFFKGSTMITSNTPNGKSGLITSFIEHNIITGNKSTTKKNTRTIYIKNGLSTINHNNVYNNMDIYSVYNDNSKNLTDIDATHNWWGTINNSKIQHKIYDWVQNPTKGIVNYKPILKESSNFSTHIDS